MKIGLLFGCFNPIHNGHLGMAKTLLNDNIIDKVLIIPAKININTKDSKLISDKFRYEMIELAISDLKNIEVSDIEIKRNEQNYTYQTVIELKEKSLNDELYLIIGADNLKKLNWWKNVDILLMNVKIIAINRGEENIQEIINNDDLLKKHKNRIITISSSKSNSISSTLVRNKIKNNEDVKDLIDEKVLEYIVKNNLYKGEFYE